MGIGSEEEEVTANLPHLDSLSTEEMERSMKYMGRNKLFIESKGYKGIKHTKALELSKWKNPGRSGDDRPFDRLDDDKDEGEAEEEEERLLLWEKWQRLGRVSRGAREPSSDWRGAEQNKVDQIRARKPDNSRRARPSLGSPTCKGLLLSGNSPASPFHLSPLTSHQRTKMAATFFIFVVVAGIASGIAIAVIQFEQAKNQPPPPDASGSSDANEQEFARALKVGAFRW